MERQIRATKWKLKQQKFLHYFFLGYVIIISSYKHIKYRKEKAMKEVKDIWQFFENMNEYVYATDIETHEIVYMNRKTLRIWFTIT